MDEDWRLDPLLDKKVWPKAVDRSWSKSAPDPRSRDVEGHVFVGGLDANDTNDKDEASL